MLKIYLAACALSVCLLGATPAIAGTCPPDWPAATLEELRAAHESPTFESYGRNKHGKYLFRAFHKKIGDDTYQISAVSIWGMKKYPINAIETHKDGGGETTDWFPDDVAEREGWIEGDFEAFTDGEGNWCFYAYDEQYGDDHVIGIFIDGDPFDLESGLLPLPR